MRSLRSLMFPSDAKEGKAAQVPRLQRNEKNGRPRAVLLGGSGRK